MLYITSIHCGFVYYLPSNENLNSVHLSLKKKKKSNFLQAYVRTWKSCVDSQVKLLQDYLQFIHIRIKHFKALIEPDKLFLCFPPKKSGDLRRYRSLETIFRVVLVRKKNENL